MEKVLPQSTRDECQKGLTRKEICMFVLLPAVHQQKQNFLNHKDLDRNSELGPDFEW